MMVALATGLIKTMDCCCVSAYLCRWWDTVYVPRGSHQLARHSYFNPDTLGRSLGGCECDACVPSLCRWPVVHSSHTHSG